MTGATMKVLLVVRIGGEVCATVAGANRRSISAQAKSNSRLT